MSHYLTDSVGVPGCADNVLYAGDVDSMRSMLDFYARMLPYVQARSAAQFRGSPIGGVLTNGAALYNEVITQFGTYHEANWGCNSSANREALRTRPYGASNNRFIRFHFTGSLELSLMALDLFDVTQEQGDLRAYLPMITAVIDGFRQRFPNYDSTTGKIDMWPAQALETWGCHNFTGAEGGGAPTRQSCITNPSTDIAGLMAVLPRLIALPSTLTTAAQRAAWKSHLAALPSLPVANAGQCFLPDNSAECMGSHYNGTRFHAKKFAPVSQPSLGSADLAAQKQNSENTELYCAQPFRLVGVGKDPEHLSMAQQTYVERTAPCNVGWCQDLLQAASLNLTAEATQLLIERAAIGPVISGCKNANQKGCVDAGHGFFRFRGFTPDGEAGGNQPNNNQLSGMRTGLNKMLMAPLDDRPTLSMLLFPTFPTSIWNVRFKLQAPRNTSVEASCQGGELEYLIVTPKERLRDMRVLNCRKTVATVYSHSATVVQKIKTDDKVRTAPGSSVHDGPLLPLLPGNYLASPTLFPAAQQPLECQPFASHPTWPLFHIMQEVAENQTDGTVQLAKGGINDANAIFKHGEYYHVMHQDHSNGSSWGHLVSKDLAHWTRIGMVIPPKDPYGVGQEGQCDGSFSAPAGIGPVILWTPDCDIGPIRPAPPPGPAPPAGSLGGPDRPRVAVAFPKNSSDPLLREFVMQPNLTDFGESVPGGDPGRVFKSQKGEYWNTLMCYNGTWPTTLARYTSTDPKLLKWTLSDKNFASIVDDTTGKAIGAVGAIAPAMFYALPGAPAGTFIINSMEGEQWAVGTYDPQTEKMTVKRSASHERPVVGGRAWQSGGALSGTYAEYLFTATGPAGEAEDGADRLLQIGWVWKGDWKRDPSPNQGSVDLLSLIYDLRFDAAVNKLVAAPVPEYSKLHNGTLVTEQRVSLPAGTTSTLPLKDGAGSTVEIRLSLLVPASADTSSSIGLALLAPITVSKAKGDAAQMWLTISAAARNGSRIGTLNLTNHHAPPNIGTLRVAAVSFPVLVDEGSVELRVFIDRVMIEASAMHGRATVIAEEYRPVPASAVHMLAPMQQPGVVENLTVWSMGCGMTPLTADET